jgi:hypothetical protein
MFASYLYWFLYRRRNKFIILLIIIFCISFFYYHNDNQVSSESNNQSTQSKHTKKNNNEKKIRINRETYTIPAPCRGCPGEEGQGVQLKVIGKKMTMLFCLLGLFQEDESKGLDAVMKKEFFNLRASDKVSLWRSIPDTRDQLYVRPLSYIRRSFIIKSTSVGL